MRRQLYSAIAALSIVSAAFGADVVYLKANAMGDGSGDSWANACTTLADAVAAAAGQKPVYAARGWYQGAPTVTMVDGTALYGGFRGDETGTTNAIFAARDPAANLTVFARVAPTALYWRHAVPGNNTVTYSNLAAATHPVFTVDADGVPAFNPPPEPEGDYDGYVIGGQSSAWKLFAITQNNGSTIDGIWSIGGNALVDSVNTTGAPRRIRNCRFYGCSGGAVLGNNQNIERTDKVSIRVEDCEFRYATFMQARPYGGQMVIDRCLFTDIFRTEITHGGAVIYSWYFYLTLRDSVFTRCAATASPSAEASVYYCPANCVSWENTSKNVITDCVFSNNLSMSRGGYGMPLFTPKNATVRGCLITRNRLETQAVAGRRYALVASSLRAEGTCAYEGCTFESNSVAATVSEAGTFAVGILCNAPTGKMGVYNCAFVDNSVTCEDDGVSTPVLSQGVIFSETEASAAGARAAVVNCAFIRSAADPDIKDVVQIGLHTADFHVINSVFTRGNRAQYNPFYASFPTKFHVRFCSVGGLTVKPDWLDIEDGWQTDAVPLGRVTDAATGRVSYRPLCKMPSLRDCAEVVTNSLTANVVEPDQAPYYFTCKMRLSSESSWVSLLGDTLSAAYEGHDFADAFGAARPVAAATRGPVQALPAAAETGRTLLVRSEPYGTGVYTPDYWQVVQSGDAMTPVSAASANPSVATFSHWEDASGTPLAGAALDLGVLADDITIAKGVFTVPQVTIVLDLGVYGVFTADGTTRMELTLPVDSAFPLCTVGNASDYVFMGWDPALPERVPATDTTYRGYGVTKDLRIVYLAPADDPVAANGAGDGTSWANAYRGDFIAAYRDAGTWRGEVWIKRGVYDATRSLDLLSNVHVRGGFAGTETVASQADPVANPVIYTGDANHDNRYNASGSTDTGVAVIDYENLAYNLPAPASRLTYWSATRNVSDGVSVAFTATTSVTNSVVEGLIVTGFKDKAANVSPIAHVGWRKCVFIGNNTAVNGGEAGAAFANYGACAFEDCDFIAMHTPLAILDNDTTQTDSNLLVRCRFLFNHGNASGTGGGFIANNTRRDLILDDCEFADTYVWEYQGYQRCPVQIYCKNLTMRDCRILRNTYKNRCVAAFDIENVTGNLTIERCVFRDNQKYGHGTDSGMTAAALRLAALKWGSGYRHVVRDTLFEGNSVVHQESCNGAMQAVRQASALSHSQGLLEVVNCTFVSNYVDTAGAAAGTFGATVHAGRNGSQGYALFANCLFKDNEVKGYTTCDVMCHSSVTNTPVLFVNTVFASKAAGYMPLLLHSNGYVAFRALNCAIQGYAPGAYPSAQWGWDIGNTDADATPDRRIARGPNGAYAIRAKAAWAAQAGRKIHLGTDGFCYVSMPEVNDAKPYFRLSNATTYSTWWQTAVAGMTAENEADLRNRDAFGNPPRNRRGIPSLGPVNFVEGATILTLR